MLIRCVFKFIRIAASKPSKGANDPLLEIPLEAWMFFQRLWEFGFYTEHHVSNDMTKLFVMIGLPHKVTLSQALVCFYSP